jgi:hypothetical protein
MLGYTRVTLTCGGVTAPEELELLLEELELLLDDELLEVLEELVLELLLEVLEELVEVEELEELVLDEELLEEVDEDELELLLLEDVIPEELELELEELLLEVPPSPVQVGATKLPSCVPRKPKTFTAVWPGWGNCQLNSLLNVRLVPQNGLAAGLLRIAFQSLVQQTDSGQVKVTVQLLNAVVPVLVTLTSTWKEVPFGDDVTVQLCAANA